VEVKNRIFQILVCLREILTPAAVRLPARGCSSIIRFHRSRRSDEILRVSGPGNENPSFRTGRSATVRNRRNAPMPRREIGEG